MNEISGYGTVLLFIIGGSAFILVTLLISKILRPNLPNQEKRTTYESGEEPEGTANVQFNMRFYIIALIFLLFEAELVFLFPWALVFGDSALQEATSGLWAIFTLIETCIFVMMLALGLAYVWKNNMLIWVKPKDNKPDFTSKIPNHMYANYN